MRCWQAQADETQQLRQQVDSLQASRVTHGSQDDKKVQLLRQMEGLQGNRVADDEGLHAHRAVGEGDHEAVRASSGAEQGGQCTPLGKSRLSRLLAPVHPCASSSCT